MSVVLWPSTNSETSLATRVGEPDSRTMPPMNNRWSLPSEEHVLDPVRDELEHGIIDGAAVDVVRGRGGRKQPKCERGRPESARQDHGIPGSFNMTLNGSRQHEAGTRAVHGS